MPRKAPKAGKIRVKSLAGKRFRVTGSGKVVSRKASHNHLLLQKSAGQKAKASKAVVLPKGETKKAKKMLGI